MGAARVKNKIDDLKKPKAAVSPESLSRQNSTLKVVLLGDSGVGKTCLRSQLVHRVFSNAYKATIGGDFLSTSVGIEPKSNPNPTASIQSRDSNNAASFPSASDHSDHKMVSLQVWDTAGQERFNSITQAFYRGADVALLVYDITKYESLLSVRDWFSRFLEHCQVDSPGIVIVGNKSDKSAERAVDKDEVQDILCRNDTLHLCDHVSDWTEDVLEISCKNMASVDAVFRRVAAVGLSKKLVDQSRDRCAGSVTSVKVDEARAVSSSCAC